MTYTEKACKINLIICNKTLCELNNLIKQWEECNKRIRTFNHDKDIKISKYSQEIDRAIKYWEAKAMMYRCLLDPDAV